MVGESAAIVVECSHDRTAHTEVFLRHPVVDKTVIVLVKAFDPRVDTCSVQDVLGLEVTIDRIMCRHHGFSTMHAVATHAVWEVLLAWNTFANEASLLYPHAMEARAALLACEHNSTIDQRQHLLTEVVLDGLLLVSKLHDGVNAVRLELHQLGLGAEDGKDGRNHVGLRVGLGGKLWKLACCERCACL